MSKKRRAAKIDENITRPAKTGRDSPNHSMEARAMAIMAHVGGFQKDRDVDEAKGEFISMCHRQGQYVAIND